MNLRQLIDQGYTEIYAGGPGSGPHGKSENSRKADKNSDNPHAMVKGFGYKKTGSSTENGGPNWGHTQTTSYEHPTTGHKMDIVHDKEAGNVVQMRHNEYGETVDREGSHHVYQPGGSKITYDVGEMRDHLKSIHGDQ